MGPGPIVTPCMHRKQGASGPTQEPEKGENTESKQQRKEKKRRKTRKSKQVIGVNNRERKKRGGGANVRQKANEE